MTKRAVCCLCRFEPNALTDFAFVPEHSFAGMRCRGTGQKPRMVSVQYPTVWSVKHYGNSFMVVRQDGRRSDEANVERCESLDQAWSRAVEMADDSST